MSTSGGQSRTVLPSGIFFKVDYVVSNNRVSECDRHVQKRRQPSSADSTSTAEKKPQPFR